MAVELTCRLCLNSHQDLTPNIFEVDSDGNSGVPLAEKLFDLFQIKYENIAPLPSRICQQCFNMVENFDKFRESIKTCEYELKKRLETPKSTNGQNDPTEGDEARPGLNGVPGVFVPEDNCVITEIDPNQLYYSSEDDFSMESDSELEEPVSFSKNEVHPEQQQQHKQLNGDNPDNHNALIPAETILQNTTDDFNGYTVASGSGVESVGVEFAVKNTYLCQFCDMAFINQIECVDHEACHDSATPFACSFCPLQTVSRPNLIYHIKEAHDPERPYICGLCNKGFCRRSDLKKHTIVHTGVRPYTCPMCGKCFSRNTNLTKHMRIHSSIKPHVCLRCPRSFTTAVELIRHAQSHTEIKPFQCNRCSASFNRKDKLQIHIQTHYKRDSTLHGSQNRNGSTVASLTENMENKYGNSILSAQLQQRPAANYKSFGMSKINSRLFNCNICHKSFTRERDLQRHQALHLDSLFTCSVCGTGFNRREKLARHELEHQEPQYSCNLCNATFMTQEVFDMHIKMHEMQHANTVFNTAAASNIATDNATIIPTVRTSSAISKNSPTVKHPSAADMSFYKQMVPTMGLGFYSETIPDNSSCK